MKQNGYTLMHEHITIDLSGIKKDDDCHLDCLEETIQEMKDLYTLGVRRIVDVTNIGMGRNQDYVTQVSERSGIAIVSSTGCYKEPFLPSIVSNATVEELAKLFCDEIVSGIEGTTTKAGMIGEIGTSKNEMTRLESKLFDAAILAHKQTGLPLYTHTTLGTYALQQVAYFKAQQVDLTKVIIGHLDLCDDIEQMLDVLKSGVNIGFDTIGKNNYVLDEHRIAALMEIETQGYLSQVVLSMDITRKSNMKHQGGIGYSYLFTEFLPNLRLAGMKESSIDLMLIHTPNRILGGQE